MISIFTEKFQNAAFFLRLCLPSKQIPRENGELSKYALSSNPGEEFENVGFGVLVWKKPELLENDDIPLISLPEFSTQSN